MSHLQKLQKQSPQQPAINRLLEGLPPRIRDRMMESGERVDLTFGTVLCDAETPFKYVYFPLTSFISLVVTTDGHQPLEMGLIGNEGMLGATLVLGLPSAPMRSVVQGSGEAIRLSVMQLRSELAASPALADQLNRYVYVLLKQLAKNAACIHFHEVEPRLARWLLMTHDRTQTDQLHLTHEFLANMLGVRRSSITVAAGVLQAKKFIHYSRGEISILDRNGLETAACECYQKINRDYNQVFGAAVNDSFQTTSP